MPDIYNLEIHVAHACNLACESCSHYSNHGFFLDRHPTLPALLRDDGNAILDISIHHDSDEYRERLRPIMDLVAGWTRDYGIRVESCLSKGSWTRRYKGFGTAMEPYDDRQPRVSWENCTAKICPQIFEGRIWKCAPLAYLGMQHRRFGLSDSWAPYLAYRPLEPGCSSDELREFFAREEESHCAMCAANPERFELANPIRVHARALG